MTGIQYLRTLHEVCAFQSQERGPGVASGSELGRWLKSKSLHINGKPIGPQDPIPFPITNVVLFPNSKRRRCTLL
jgi:hypothetical protein